MNNKVRRRKIKYFYKIASQIYNLNDFNRKLNSNKFPQFTYNSPKYEIDSNQDLFSNLTIKTDSESYEKAIRLLEIFFEKLTSWLSSDRVSKIFKTKSKERGFFINLNNAFKELKTIEIIKADPDGGSRYLNASPSGRTIVVTLIDANDESLFHEFLHHFQKYFKDIEKAVYYSVGLQEATKEHLKEDLLEKEDKYKKIYSEISEYEKEEGSRLEAEENIVEKIITRDYFNKYVQEKSNELTKLFFDLYEVYDSRKYSTKEILRQILNVKSNNLNMHHIREYIKDLSVKMRKNEVQTVISHSATKQWFEGYIANLLLTKGTRSGGYGYDFTDYRTGKDLKFDDFLSRFSGVDEYVKWIESKDEEFKNMMTSRRKYESSKEEASKFEEQTYSEMLKAPIDSAEKTLTKNKYAKLKVYISDQNTRKIMDKIGYMDDNKKEKFKKSNIEHMFEDLHTDLSIRQIYRIADDNVKVKTVDNYYNYFLKLLKLELPSNIYEDYIDASRAIAGLIEYPKYNALALSSYYSLVKNVKNNKDSIPV